MLGREWPPIQAADALRGCRGRDSAAAQMSFLSMPDSAELRASRMRSARPEAWELADCPRCQDLVRSFPLQKTNVGA